MHVWDGNESICRIELRSGVYMDEPPPGNYRSIMVAYLRHATEIRRAWNEIHGT